MSHSEPERLQAIQARMAHDFEGALEETYQVVAEAPSSVPARKTLAFLLNFKKDLEGAIAALNEARELAPGDADIAFNLGYCEMQRANFATAVPHLAECAGAPAHAGLAQCLIALCEDWQGNPEAARDTVLNALQQEPQDPRVLYLAHRLATPDQRKSATAALLDLLQDAAQRAGLVQFINSYDMPIWRQLDDKASLTTVLQATGSDGPNYPDTYIMPDQRDALLASKPPAIWIAKPSVLFGGQSVTITDDPHKIPAGDGWVAQRYIGNPLLVDGRKAHVRIHLAITSLAPFSAHLYGNGIVRHAPRPYDASPAGLTDDAAHITNTARYKHDDELARQAAVISLSQYLAAAGRNRFADGHLSGQLLDLARALAAVVSRTCIPEAGPLTAATAMPAKLLGVDVLFDDTGKPWLLEVERYPALSDTTPAGSQVQAQLMTDLTRLALTTKASPPAWTTIDLN